MTMYIFSVHSSGLDISRRAAERECRNFGWAAQRLGLYGLIKTLMINDNILCHCESLISNERIYTEPERNPSLQFNDGVDCFSQVCCWLRMSPQWCSSLLYMKKIGSPELLLAAVRLYVRTCRRRARRSSIYQPGGWPVQPQELWVVSWRALCIYRPITRI